MRPNNNQRRPRGRNGGGNKNKPQRNQTFDSNGPEVRVRGNAHQIFEKYQVLAREAAAAGDRIAAESYYQHAEHYLRLINAMGGFHRNPSWQDGDMGEDGEGGRQEGNAGAGGNTAANSANGYANGGSNGHNGGGQPRHRDAQPGGEGGQAELSSGPTAESSDQP